MSSWIKRVFAKDEPEEEDLRAAFEAPRSLRSDGILEIRPVVRKPAPPEPEPADSSPPEAPQDAAASGDGAVDHAAPAPDPTAPEPAPVADAAPPRSPAVAALLQSARAAVGAQTVALFWHDAEDDTFALDTAEAEPAGAFVLDALDTDHEATQRTGRFRATAALADVPADANVVLSGGALAALGYYADPEATLGHAAAIPVPLADGPVTFLVADRPAEHAAFDTDRLALLVAYAGLLGDLLALDPPTEWAPNGEPARTGPPRTRREIIAEEMDAARQDGRPLALALVYRADAEEVAAQGARAVEQGERRLRSRIERATPEGRIERFGELMFGVFMAASGEQIESWAEELHTAPLPEGMDGVAPPLHLGAVVMTDLHDDPEAFRAAATRALEEAYAEDAGWVIYDERSDA